MLDPARCARSALIAALPSLLLGACTVGPTYEIPEPSAPDLWHQELTHGLSTGEADLRTWWMALDSPEIERLIERASAGSFALQEAVARIEEARAERGVAAGERYPDLDATGLEQRTRISDEVLEDRAVPPPIQRTDTFYSLGGAPFWELDLFGRIRRSVESADADLQASVENYRDVLVSLSAEIGISYVEVRSLQSRIRSALGNVEAQRRSMELTVERRRVGLGSDLDVSQAQLNLSSTESFVPRLRILLARAVHRLGVLLGEAPSALSEELATPRPTPLPPAEIAIGLPADLIRRRPDVRRAERELAAQTARTGIATAALYPAFSLAGTLGVQSFSGGGVFESGSRGYALGPQMRWNLFDGGGIRSNIRVQDARARQALARYEQTVLRALEEAENALAGYAGERDRHEALARSVDSARRAVDLVNTLYRSGLTDFQNVLDTERSLFVQEDELAESEGVVTQNLIRIYRALGGGWSADLTPATAP